jgi:uncharacterized membrane protein
MTTVEEAIDVEVPLRTAYDQWTQFELFPRFMDSIVEVRQLDETFLHWVAEAGGNRREWDAEIVRQVPDRVIAWRAVDSSDPSGEVNFASVGDTTTHVSVRMEYEPQGTKQAVGAMLGLDERRVRKDLERFKELVETRGVETGAWRGTVAGGEVAAADDPRETPL